MVARYRYDAAQFKKSQDAGRRIILYYLTLPLSRPFWLCIHMLMIYYYLLSSRHNIIRPCSQAKGCHYHYIRQASQEERCHYHEIKPCTQEEKDCKLWLIYGSQLLYSLYTFLLFFSFPPLVFSA